MNKFEVYIDDNAINKFNTGNGVIDLHNGEVVEVRTGDRPKWNLIRTEDSWLQILPVQFELGPNYRAPRLSEYDRILHDV